MAFSTEPAQAEQVIPVTEKKAVDSITGKLFSGWETPAGYLGIEG